MTEPGTLSHGTGGALRIAVDAEKYRIEAEDLKNLLFYGRVIPICEDHSRTTPGGIRVSEKRLAAGQELEKPGGFRVGRTGRVSPPDRGFQGDLSEKKVRIVPLKCFHTAHAV